MFSCTPQQGEDPRIKLLRQSTVTGLPSRSRALRLALPTSRAESSEPVSSLSLAPPSPPTLLELQSIQLHVDISTVYEDSEEDCTSVGDDHRDNCSAAAAAAHRSTKSNDPFEDSVPSIPNFSRRAYVSTGSYRVGWVVDTECSRCAGCEKIFSTTKRKHHCRGCGELFCEECSSFRVPIPELLGSSHRVCSACFDKASGK